ncbi:DUF2232 domain-containing protein [Lichenihabitans sp. Uapishka_5]|uniref:DUF2232 domain-containing protein n=1 Tax=Lichenihabitans sp. Uapishka_5 TaxID=3037302 RepID=UPI0029E7D13B|nr:DUF2232 domain-containing protein [Lichenihabitans sp. Uapishka_5]MDX7950922.1 DUF2232 domain-containing protein [Lichenihabitans sp. Uapishka_5]
MASLKPIGVAAGAGLASALLFAASAKGGPLAIVIAYATPLPIMIATLGFAQATGLIAAGVGTVTILALLGLLPAVFFAVLIGLPSWWLGYLSLLGRPTAEPVPTVSSAAPAMAWYPIGRVAASGAALVTLVVLGFGAATLAHYGGYETAVAALTAHLKTMLAQAGPEGQLAEAAGSVVRLLPSLMAASTFLMLMLNLWVAGRVVQGSGLLARPWPTLPEHLRLPRWAAYVLVGAALATLLGSIAGMVAGVVLAPLAVAFVLQGLGAAHALTRGLAARRLILFAIYFITLSLVPSLLALAVLGVVDCLTPLRRPRALPPTPSNQPR